MFVGPAGHVGLTVIRLLQMIGPLQKRRSLLDQDAEAFRDLLAIARHAELRDQAWMQDRVLRVFLQILLRGAHPQRIAVDDDAPITNRAGVMLNQSDQGERIGAFQAEVREALLACFSIEVMGERLLPGDIFAPDHGIAEDAYVEMLRRQCRIALEDPIILADFIWHAIIGFERKRLDLISERPRDEDKRDGEYGDAAPLTGGEPDAVGKS